MGVHVPGLQKKLQLLYAYSGLNAAKLAHRVKRAPTTFAGWIHGSKTTSAEHMPEYGLERLAEVLVEELGGALDVAAARRLWLGSPMAFSRAFSATPVEKFLDVLAKAERKTMLTYISDDTTKFRLVKFFDQGKEASGVIRAKVGSRFAFDIADRAGRQIVLLVESAAGIHLGVPGPGSRARLDQRGRARVPDHPNTYQFEEPKGLHRFLAFAIEAVEPLSIAAAAGRTTPLFESELETFATELDDSARVRAWSLDIALVDVQ